MRRILAAALGAAFLASAANAASPERLVVGPYPASPAWRMITNQAEGGGAWIREWAPPSQRGPEYPDIVTAQSFPSARGEDPAAFLRVIFGRTAGACDQVRVNGPVTHVEGGYRVAYAQVYCSHERGKTFGVNMFFKAIGGADALYAVNRHVQVPPSAVAGVQSFANAADAARAASAAALANRFLSQSVYVCGGASTDARCR